MPIVDLEQEIAASIMNEALDRLCHRFMWSRDEAYGFLLGASVAWRIYGGRTDARILEEVKETLAACRVAMPLPGSAPKPPA